MHIIHGTWIPTPTHQFHNGGGFYCWVESEEVQSHPSLKTAIPHSLPHEPLFAFFSQEIKLPARLVSALQGWGQTCGWIVPTLDGQALPSAEMMDYLGMERPEQFSLQSWQVDCFRIVTPLAFLKELQFICLHYPQQYRLAPSLQFWAKFAQVARNVILLDQYIPCLYATERADKAKPAETAPKKAEPQKAKRGRKKEDASVESPPKQLEFSCGWKILSNEYEAAVRQFAQAMPISCRGAHLTMLEAPEAFCAEGLLRQFSEQQLEELVFGCDFTQQLRQQTQNSFLQYCLANDPQHNHSLVGLDKMYQQWLSWSQQLASVHIQSECLLGFRLVDPVEEEASWMLEMLVESRVDPSFKLPLAQYWAMGSKEKSGLSSLLGKDFEKNLFLQMGSAAQVYPRLWLGMESSSPGQIDLNTQEAYSFLKEYSWILHASGYRVIVPSWYTPEGRRRAMLRMRVTSSAIPTQDRQNTGYFSLDSLLNYRYELAIGGQKVSQEEWDALINAKTPLVHFRGQWMEIDPQQMQEMLALWQQQEAGEASIGLMELMRQAAEKQDQLELEYSGEVSAIFERLQQKQQLEPIQPTTAFNGTLREYQARGLSWLYFLESLGLNPCLADDMGLGKTVQVIALLQKSKEENPVHNPTLLIAPTSVLGNWKKEIERFAPNLSAQIHHGTLRLKEAKEFNALCQENDVIITSFSLVRIDSALMTGIRWRRVVIDEAQNIKNPTAAQTKAMLKLKADHKLALTGTPIENRLLDLWSIFNFLNPGYLGNLTQFKRVYEVPVQKENDRHKLHAFKQLVEPFILRRVKTDRSIIQDLPDKVEQKVWCNLTREQASLYQSVVNDVQFSLDDAEGISRDGLILGTLTRLKQICNHPAQFLKDGSQFSIERSHKLQRLFEMMEEVLENGESMLIFSQFKEIGENLDNLCKQHLHCRTWFLHGGTSATRRQKMIEDFQDPNQPGGVFILSLKAGGVGITLTRANHVFHFDRWWNPAVENQATDRAFRIGQTKNVFVHKFIATGTLEERIDAMLEDKQKLSDQVVGSDESWLSKLDNEMFIRLIQLNQEALME